jgi:DNA-binding NarL/FixJ family response regulator
MIDALRDQPDLEIVAVLSEVDEALPCLEHCDVILFSLGGFVDDEALEVVKRLARVSESAKILVAGLPAEATPLPYLETGAAGYILDNATVNELIDNIWAVYQGQARVSSEVAGGLIARLQELASTTPQLTELPDPVELTVRECEVLDLVAQRLTNREIARRLIIEIGTVKNHLHNILCKLNVKSRQEAAWLWHELKRHTG